MIGVFYMEEEIFKITASLTAAIRESRYYKDYTEAKAYIDKRPDLKNKIFEFKKNHLEFQRKKIGDEQISFDYEKNMSKAYYSLILNDDVRKFLESEQVLIKLLSEVYNKITNDCMLDLDF